MKASVILGLLLASTAVLALSTKEDISITDPRTNFPCTGFKAKEYTFYAFNVDLKKAYRVEYPIAGSISFDGQDWTGLAIVDLCTSVVSSDPDCSGMGQNSAIGYLKLTNTVDQSKRCLPLSNPTTKQTWELSVRDQISSAKSQSGFVVAPTAADAAVPIKPVFQMWCSEKGATQTVSSTFNPNSNTVTLAAASPSFCAHNSGRYISFMTNNKYFPIVLIPIAIFMIFWGIKFIKVILFKMGFLVGLVGSISLAVAFSDPTNWKTSSMLLVGFIGIVTAVLVGYLFAKFTKFYLMLAGGFLGYFFSFKAFEIVTLFSGTSSDTTQLVTVILCMIFGAILGFFLHDHIFIISTAFGGSLLLCMAVGTLLGNYPDLENLPNIKDLGQKGDEEKRKMLIQFVVYSLAWLFVAVAGICVQYKHRKEQKDGPKASFGSDSESDYKTVEYYGYNTHPAHRNYSGNNYM